MKFSHTPLTPAKDKAVFDSMVESNMGLVYSAAKMFLGRGCDFEDLVQVGAIGLIKAVKRFDTSFGVCFSTYAVPMITGEIRRFLRDDGIIKISRTVKENAYKGKKAMENLRKKTGEEPTLNEISEESGIPAEDLMYAFEAVNSCMPEDADEHMPCSVSYEDETVDRIFIAQTLSQLSARERSVIVLRYMNGKTQSQIAKLLGISQVQVSRIEKKAIANMQKRGCKLIPAKNRG